MTTGSSPAAAMPWRRFVACGDSFTEGLCDPAPAVPADGVPTDASAWLGWADRTAMALARAAAAEGAVLEYANLAVRGRLLHQILGVQVPAALDLRPDLVSLVGGGNDTLRPGCDVDALAAQLEAAVVRIRATGADVLLSTATDPAASPVLRRVRGRAAAFTANVWTIARRHGCRVLDLWGTPSLYHPQMWAADRIHLSAEGHRRVAMLALDTLGRPDPDLSWRTPLPAPAPTPRAAALRSDVEWARTYLAPWVARRVRGRSSGDGVPAKRPLPLPFADAVPQESAGATTGED